MTKRSKFSVLKHELVPKHEILSEEDVKTLLHTYNINKEQLPKIKSSDAVIKEVGAKVEDVVKITRRSGTAGISLFYRYVVE